VLPIGRRVHPPWGKEAGDPPIFVKRENCRRDGSPSQEYYLGIIYWNDELKNVI